MKSKYGDDQGGGVTTSDQVLGIEKKKEKNKRLKTKV